MLLEGYLGVIKWILGGHKRVIRKSSKVIRSLLEGNTSYEYIHIYISMVIRGL